MRLQLIRAGAVVAVFAGIATTAGAESADDKKTVAERIKEVEIDMPSSTAPAVFLLGASGETVPRTASFREFSTQIARAFDERGKASNAVAVELAPYLALSDVTWASLKQPVNRILARTNLSLANKIGGDDSGRQSAIGIQSVLYSLEQDAAISAGYSPECRVTADKVSTPLPPSTIPKSKEEYQSAIHDPKREEALVPLMQELDACQRQIDFYLKKWNQTMVSVGAGRIFSSSNNSATSTNTSDPSAYWITASYARDIGDKPNLANPDRNYGYMVTSHYRRMTHAPAVTTTGEDITAAMKLWGINFRYGTAKSAVIVEYSQANFDALAVDTRKRSLLGFEQRVAKDIYVTVGFARDVGDASDKNSILAKLNWGISKTPQFIKEAQEDKSQ